MLNVIRTPLGDYALHTPSETLLDKKQGGAIPNDVASLQGARFVTAVEANASRTFEEALVKQLTGGDPVTARFLNKEFFEFLPVMKLWLATNHLPKISTGEAMFSRVRRIPFDVTIPEDQRDPNLQAALEEELDGILSWAYRGVEVWRVEGLAPPSAVMKATSEYAKEMDVVRRFLEEQTIADVNGRVAKDRLYEAFGHWCVNNGDHQMTKRAFGPELKAKGMADVRAAKGKWFWQGVELASEELEVELVWYRSTHLGDTGAASDIRLYYYISTRPMRTIVKLMSPVPPTSPRGVLKFGIAITIPLFAAFIFTFKNIANYYLSNSRAKGDSLSTAKALRTNESTD